MGTRLVWIVPAFYDLTDAADKPLRFSLLRIARKILKNNVWERKYNFGNTSSLSRIKPNSITKANIILPPYYWISSIDYSDKRRIRKIINNYCKDIFKNSTDVVDKSNVDCGRSIVVFDFEFSFDVNGISQNRSEWKIDFVESYDMLTALVEEIGAIFRAACYLIFHCKFPIMPSLRSQEGGLVHISSFGKTYFCVKPTRNFNYPAILTKNEIHLLRKMLSILSKVWHLNMWPLFRYLKSLSGTYIPMENFLDLMFALEGLFDRSTSSDFIKLACISIIKKDKKEAIKSLGTLTTAFRMRNEIVHGENSYSGMEKVKICGKEVLSQEVFFNLRKIVAEMIVTALFKLVKNEKMKNLRINHNDIIDTIF